MKPFNLERALAGDPVVTRDGRKVDALHLCPEWIGESTRLLAKVNGRAVYLYPAGTMFAHGNDDNDLFMAPKVVKHQRWVNLYANGLVAGSYLSEERAKAGAAPVGAIQRFIERESEE